MGLTIIAGGCRSTTADGKTTTTRCAACPSQGACELEPRARELATIVSDQWVSTADLAPPEETRILYLEYLSGLESSAVRLGSYDAAKGAYLEAASGQVLPEKTVIAWMLIPEAPPAIYQSRRIARRRLSRLTAVRTLD